MIRASSLGYTFASGRIGIATADLTVEAGELIALVGPNGSGKTTLLRLLAGDLVPTTGTLETASRSHVGFAPAQPLHFDELTGRENAYFYAAAYGISHATVDDHLERFVLSEDADVAVGEYSFGMQRKLQLLQAMAHDPPLLLLDEPTIGLDPLAITVLTDELQDRVRAGRAVVIGTNDVRAAMQASRVVFIHRGRKIADASPAELLNSIPRVTRIVVTLSAPPSDAPRFPASVIAEVTATECSFAAPDSSVLPAICAALQAAGACIAAVRVRESDLADVFRALTGEALQEHAVV